MDMSINHYTLIVSGSRFILTEEQLASEPGNKLAIALVNTREYTLSAEEAMFKLIQAHLRGYEILPIPDAAIPYYMSKTTMITNLLFEAERWKLTRLTVKIKEYQNLHPEPKDSPPRKYKLSHWRNNAWQTVDISETGFKHFLQKFYDSPTNRPGIFGADEIPGYSFVGAWEDPSYGNPYNWVVLYESEE